LLHHPHLHCVVPGGGLSPDETRWGQRLGRTECANFDAKCIIPLYNPLSLVFCASLAVLFAYADHSPAGVGGRSGLGRRWRRRGLEVESRPLHLRRRSTAP
jgi:hypothetical protein